MHYPNTEEYQNNMVSQISGKISHMCKRLKPGVLSAVANARYRGGYLSQLPQTDCQQNR